jgi:hypothetical protein
MNAERFIRAVTLAGAAVVIVAGAWAFLGPGSFYERVAHLPPSVRASRREPVAVDVRGRSVVVLAARGRVEEQRIISERTQPRGGT